MSHLNSVYIGGTFFAKMPSTVTATICLGNLGQNNTNRVYPICIKSPKVAKASSHCCCRKHTLKYTTIFLLKTLA